MEKNKRHMDAEEFFKSFDADLSSQTDLDEFDREALEGLKFVKDPALAQKRLEDNIEKLFVEKKEKRRGGLYLVSIAASLVLAFGLFFVFNNVSKEAKVADTSASPQAGKDASDLEQQITSTNSDASVKEEKPLFNSNKQVVVSGNGVPAQEVTVPAEAYFAEGEADLATSMTDSVSTGYFEAKAINEKNLETEKAKIVKEEWKREEDALKQKEKMPVTTPVATGGTIPNKDIAKKDEVKSRAVLGKKGTKKSDETADEVALVPAAKSESLDQTVVAADPVASDDNDKLVEQKNKVTNDSKVVVNNNANNTVSNGTNNIVVTGSTNTNTNNTTNSTGPGTTFSWSPSTAAGSTTSTSYTTVITDKKAQYIGGKKAMMDFIKKNIQIPVGTPKNFSVGVKITIDDKGKVKKVTIKNNTSGSPDCDKEINRLINSMPAWSPEIKGGKAVESSQWIDVPFVN